MDISLYFPSVFYLLLYLSNVAKRVSEFFPLRHAPGFMLRVDHIPAEEDECTYVAASSL